jgi:lipoprotein-anchoring transpeptidase ErfK/SrfK
MNLRIAPLLLLLPYLVSCQSARPPVGATQYLGGLWDNGQPGIYNQPNPGSPELLDNVSYWDGDFVGGSPRIEINLSEQKAFFFKGDQIVGIALVATGKEGYNTPAGQYRIMEKTADKKSNLYGWIYDGAGNVINTDADIRKDRVPSGGRFEGADMPFWMRLTSSGIGMHLGPIPVPGQPASHGCIRISKKVASTFFANVAVGTPVSIRY